MRGNVSPERFYLTKTRAFFECRFSLTPILFINAFMDSEFNVKCIGFIRLFICFRSTFFRNESITYLLSFEGFQVTNRIQWEIIYQQSIEMKKWPLYDTCLNNIEWVKIVHGFGCTSSGKKCRSLTFIRYVSNNSLYLL